MMSMLFTRKNSFCDKGFSP